MAAQPLGSTPIVHPFDEPRPVLEYCLTNQEVLVEFPSAPNHRYATVNIVRANNPHQAYVIIPWVEQITLEHHGVGWGYICFGIILPRLEEGVYKVLNPDQYEHVAIKCLNKRVVEDALRNGSQEDPYREVLRMQTIGQDNVHVLGCIEALQDETNLYIIMPYCEQGSLHKLVEERQGLSEDEARIWFLQILEHLRYLRDHHICHRDLSIDNCMIYQGRVVFSDLARSFRLPPNASYVHGTNAHGKPAFQPPEVYLGLPYNAYGCDLWAAVIILFELLTGMKLYTWPEYDDLNFRYFILARGLSRVAWNAVTEEMWIELDEIERRPLSLIRDRHSGLSLAVREIFDCFLREDPQDRWDIDAVTTSSFMNPPM